MGTEGSLAPLPGGLPWAGRGGPPPTESPPEMDCEFLRATSCLCCPNGVGGWWLSGVPAVVSFLANPKSDVVSVLALETAAEAAGGGWWCFNRKK